jgi:hypothetical protein
MINTGEHAGLVLIGAGVLAWGIPTLKHGALGGAEARGPRRLESFQW